MSFVAPTARRLLWTSKTISNSTRCNRSTLSHPVRTDNTDLATFGAHPSISTIPRFIARGLQDSWNLQHTAGINQALENIGVAIVDLKFSDSDSGYLSDLILALGRCHGHGSPIEHSATRGWYWDVRPTEKTLNRARSETSRSFPWHTDCSYESQPPQYFGLHVLHADQYGGGTLRIINTARLLRMLSSSVYQALTYPDFRITVPPEFFKETNDIRGSVIRPERDGDGVCIRFRSDIMQPLSTNAGQALQELRELLAHQDGTNLRHLGVELTAQDLPDNSLVLIDNGRWLHSRTKVKDQRRHLRRVRWGRREFES